MPAVEQKFKLVRELPPRIDECVRLVLPTLTSLGPSICRRDVEQYLSNNFLKVAVKPPVNEYPETIVESLKLTERFFQERYADQSALNKIVGFGPVNLLACYERDRPNKRTLAQAFPVLRTWGLAFDPSMIGSVGNLMTTVHEVAHIVPPVELIPEKAKNGLRTLRVSRLGWEILDYDDVNSGRRCYSMLDETCAEAEALAYARTHKIKLKTGWVKLSITFSKDTDYIDYLRVLKLANNSSKLLKEQAIFGVKLLRNFECLLKNIGSLVTRNFSNNTIELDTIGFCTKFDFALPASAMVLALDLLIMEHTGEENPRKFRDRICKARLLIEHSEALKVLKECVGDEASRLLKYARNPATVVLYALAGGLREEKKIAARESLFRLIKHPI